VARPVGRALKDDGKVGECVIIDSPVKWIAASGINATPRNDASRGVLPSGESTITLRVKKHCFHSLDPRVKLRLPKDDGSKWRVL
jgi:hypothetical protein